MNYYNEHDPKAAAWLVELIRGGHIAPGIVDERSINDVRPGDLAGFTQCHFFAGIGVWSYALRRAGWADDRPVWTGSCPCQPFSNAGGRAGFDDERHLWPTWFQLIAQCQPAVVFGEQVASKDGLGWLDLVHADLEAARYSVGAADLCAAGVGAPHIRQRLWFVGVADTGRGGTRADRFDLGGSTGGSGGGAREQRVRADGGASGVAGGVADTQRPGLQVRADRDVRGTVGHDEGRLAVESGHGGVRVVGDSAADRPPQQQRGRVEPSGCAAAGSAGLLGHSSSGGLGEFGYAVGSGRGGHTDSAGGGTGGMAHADGRDASAEREQRSGEQRLVQADGGAGIVGDADGAGLKARDSLTVGDGERPSEPSGAGSPVRGMPTNGHWSAPDWIYCRDGRWRPVESGTFPLAHGSPERVGRLRGYGNGLVATAAEAFIASYLDVEGGLT